MKSIIKGMAAIKALINTFFFSMNASSIKFLSSFIIQSWLWLSRKTQDLFSIKDISIRDISLHEKAESILKLSLEKPCIGTGRVINWLQAKVLLCQDFGMSFVGNLLQCKPSTPTRCAFWTESCILNFSLWPLFTVCDF